VAGGEDQPGVLPVVPGRQPFAGLAVGQGAECLDRGCGEGEGAAGAFGLGVAVGYVREDGRGGGGVAVQVDEAQCKARASSVRIPASRLSVI
jgi:hypothetical protein